MAIIINKNPENNHRAEDMEVTCFAVAVVVDVSALGSDVFRAQATKSDTRDIPSPIE